MNHLPSIRPATSEVGIFRGHVGGIFRVTRRGQPSGIHFVDGGLCQYGGIDADSVLRVDFDQTVVDRSGTYLVEAVTDDGVAWMGCRRFDRGLTGLRMDDTESGDWREVPRSGLRVVGRVLKVYRAE